MYDLEGRHFELEMDSLYEGLAKRIAETEAEMKRNLSRSMYSGEESAARRRTLADWLFKWEWRFRDAWSVLRGRADVC